MISVEEKDQMQFEGFLPETTNPSEYQLHKHRSIIHRSHLGAVSQEKLFNAFLMDAKVAIKAAGGDTTKFATDGFWTTEKYIKSFIRSKNQPHFMEMVQALRHTDLKFDFFNEEDSFNELWIFSPLNEVRFRSKGRIQYFLPPTLLDLASHPESYPAIDVRIAGVLGSVYAIAIYELGIIHMNSSVTFTLAQFRQYMGLKEEEYPRNTDLRRYVLDKGCDEVNLKCDMQVAYRLMKEGKGNRVKGIEFTFSPSPEPIEVPSDQAQLEKVAELCTILPEGLRGEPWLISILKKGLEEHGEEWVVSNLEWFRKRLKIPPAVEKPGALLREAFKQDRGKEVRDANAVKAILKQKDAKPSALPEEEVPRAVARKEQCLEYFEALPEEEQTGILNAIAKTPGLVGPRDVKIAYYLTEVMGVEL